jgi:ParB-like chromosome segregation protein Spo0J
MEERHPERAQDNGLEPTVGEQVRLGKFLKQLDETGEAELRTLCRQMAHQVLVMYPSAMRYLAREAARNLSGQPWSAEASEKLMKALSENPNSDA